MNFMTHPFTVHAHSVLRIAFFLRQLFPRTAQVHIYSTSSIVSRLGLGENFPEYAITLAAYYEYFLHATIL